MPEWYSFFGIFISGFVFGFVFGYCVVKIGKRDE